MKTALLALCSIVFATASYAADLTRPISVKAGEETLSYLGTQFGQTLYTFDLDAPGTTTSACDGVCAEKWPPLLVTEEEAALLVAPLSFVVRKSKLRQVTYEGAPVYTFYLDHQEGDLKGEGVGWVWHVIPLATPPQE